MSITSNTRATFTIGGIVVAVIALVSATWRAADAVNGLRSEVSDLRRDIKNIAADRWTLRDQERWAFELERQNRELKLVVPVVPDRMTAPN